MNFAETEQKDVGLYFRKSFGQAIIWGRIINSSSDALVVEVTNYVCSGKIIGDAGTNGAMLNITGFDVGYRNLPNIVISREKFDQCLTDNNPEGYSEFLGLLSMIC